MALLRTFFEVHKGWHIQYNIVSRETLLEAKKHPDRYLRFGGPRRRVFPPSLPHCRRMRRTISSPVPSIHCKSERPSPSPFPGERVLMRPACLSNEIKFVL
ncbi:glycine radical domain-containing protein [Escherichia coli]